MTDALRSRVRLVEIDRDNWRDVAAVTPRQDQREYVADPTYYMCLSHYGGEWNCLAVELDERTVGHVMWGVEGDEGWIGGLVIDAAHQGRGIGTAAVEAVSEQLAAMDGIRQLALSYEPENTTARRLYARLGFVETGETEGDEIVARRHLA